MDLSIDKNMIDKDEYPATAEMESRCVHILADLWNSPEAATPSAARPPVRAKPACSAAWRSNGNGAHGWSSGQADRQAQSRYRPGTGLLAQFARYFDVELRGIPLERGRLGMTPDEVMKRVDENTIGVMPTLA